MSAIAVSPGSPAWMFDAAEAILVLHIGGGAAGIVSGAVALMARKGERLHRVAGTVFFAAMLTLSGIGAAAAPFLPSPDWPSAMAGLLTFYLVATAWVAVRRRDGHIGGFERAAMFAPLTVAAAGLYFIYLASISPTGTVYNGPKEAFYVFVLLGGIAAASDIKVIAKGGISGGARIARHLWRMCAALTIATFSALAQPKVTQFLPSFPHRAPVVIALAFLPLAVMAYWLIRLRFTGRTGPVQA